MQKIIEKIRLNRIELSVTMLSFLTALWIGVFLNLAFLRKIYELTPYSGFKSGLFVAATACVLIALYHLIFQFLNWKWTIKVVGVLLLVIGGFSAYFVSSLGVLISPEQVQNMMQTDVAEATDLMSLRIVIWAVLMVALPVILLCWVKIKPEKASALLLKKVINIFASAAIIAGLLFVFYVDYAAIFRENRSIKGMISPQNAIASTFSYFHKKAPKKNLPVMVYGADAHMDAPKSTSELPKLMVLVVGETARAESFSLNGYAKNTNPELSKQADLVNFKQVSSCGTATAVSVPCMFSGMPRKQYDENVASQREGLLDIAQRAGYKVTWINNNSGCKGVCNRVEQYQIPVEIQKKWCADGECKDGVLNDALAAYIAHIPKDDRQPRLIVLHQMGSHGPAYYKRPLEQYQTFKPSCDTNAIQGCSREQLINVYDNTIVYTDHVLNQVIELLKKQTNYRTGFWYVSDHGESTGESGMYLHGAPYAMAPSQQTHVPMMMWFSPAWKNAAPAQINCLKSVTNQNLSHDNLFPSLLKLLDVNSKTIDENYNILHQCAA
ncbi:phosphoethanolamine transferase [Acinetobacter rudis]|uniref:Phosphoethanolamine--lipid A transferase n=1 Tax=Acinetobacter rudis TaxID=632955 RepID=A0AAW8JDX1_9GAMM|nr:phosphoethanolamine--lipid A transferase [Acinetobacter rudis]MDQ8936790.1 phosphoethanolamine--lipid A transferase [Acinetobacter rudis]MDQ9019028.1 phosphoethanolamine--lipid A transferase [Acinetobacter rudis]